MDSPPVSVVHFGFETFPPKLKMELLLFILLKFSSHLRLLLATRLCSQMHHCWFLLSFQVCYSIFSSSLISDLYFLIGSAGNNFHNYPQNFFKNYIKHTLNKNDSNMSPRYLSLFDAHEEEKLSTHETGS